jgi:hypothetical protein
MRIDMIYYPTDLIGDAEPDVDVEASARTYTALMTKALTSEFPDARINVWYNPTEVRSSQDFLIHWSDGEIDAESRSARERDVQDRVALIAGDIRASRDWIVRVPAP